MRHHPLRLQIPATLDSLLRDWHRSCRSESVGSGFRNRSAGFSTGGACTGVEDFEEEVDAVANRVLDTLWWNLPADSRLAIEIVMGWIPDVATMRRGLQLAMDEGLERLISGLRRQGIPV